MNINNPSLVLNFLGEDLPSGHSTSQTISSRYIVNNSIKFHYQLMNGLKSSSNQVALELSKDCPATEDIISTDGDVEVILQDESTPLFSGFLSTNFSWTLAQSGEQVLKITLEDKSVRLLSKPFIESGYHLFNCSASNAIQAICVAAGLTVSSAAISITDEITKVVDSSVSCKDILDQMLYELGYVYYCDSLGELRFFKIDCASVEGIPVLDKTKLYTSGGTAIKLSKKIRQYRSVRIGFTELGTADNYLVYRNTTGQDDSHPFCNLGLAPGEHFDGLEIYTAAQWAEETADEFREDALVEACNAESETAIVGSNKIISVSNVARDATKGSDITVDIDAAGGPYIRILAHNRGSETEAITRLDAYASILYEKSNNIVRTGISGNTTDSLYSEDLSYVHSRTLATRFANLLCQYHAYSNSQYTFYSAEDLSCGDIVNLRDNLHSGLNVNVLIFAKKVTYGDVNEYTAIGISVFDLNRDVFHRTTNIAKANVRGVSSRWHHGDLLTGQTYARGAAGNEGDYYYNTTTGDVYKCLNSGSSTTAFWQWVGNIKGSDATVTGSTYEVEYGLSTSAEECIFPGGAIGYSDGSDSNSLGYSGGAFGFKNYAWSENTQGWYEGLYVWQRVKITDADGNITYNDPIYAEELTMSLLQSAAVRVVPEKMSFRSNSRLAGYQYIPLDIVNVGHRGTLTLTVSSGIFAEYSEELGWEDRTNQIEISFEGPGTLTGYAIKLPYNGIASVTIAGTFVQWAEGLGDITLSVLISPSEEKSTAMQMLTVNTYAQLPDGYVNRGDGISVNLGDRLITGDYILVKFVTLTPTSSTAALDEEGNSWEFSHSAAYYTDVTGAPVPIGAFEVGTTYYMFRIYSWMYDSETGWARTNNESVQISTVGEVVALAQAQALVDSSINFAECLYAYQAYITNLTVGILTVGKIFANNIESTNYTEDSNGTPESGYKLEYNGGEDGKGAIKSYGGEFANMNVRGAIRLWKDNDKEVVGADIEHPALTTISEVMAEDPIGVDIDTEAVAWESDSLISQLAALTPNAMISASGSFRSKVINAAMYLTDISTVIVGASSSTVASGGLGAKSYTFVVPSYFASEKTFVFRGVRNCTQATGWIPVGKIRQYGSVRVTVLKSGVTSVPLNSGSDTTTFSDYQTTSIPWSCSVALSAGDRVTIELGAAGYVADYNHGHTDGYIAIDSPSLTAAEAGIVSAGVFFKCSDNSIEVFAPGQSFLQSSLPLELVVNSSPALEFDSSDYLNLRDCSVLLDYRTFVDAESQLRSLLEGRTYEIESSDLTLKGVPVIAKFFCRTESSVFLTYEYGQRNYTVEITLGNYYGFYGNIRIAETLTKGVKMMGQYPKRDADDLQGGFDCGNSLYTWEHGYFKYLHYQNLDPSSKREMKENIEDFTESAMDIFNRTKIVTYNYKKDKDKERKIGLIADDSPEEISGENHDTRKDDHIIALLIKAVQELSERINILEEK